MSISVRPRRKLQEARALLSQVVREDRNASGGDERFGPLFSAFLSSAQSVVLVLEDETGLRGEALLSRLPAAEQFLVEFMRNKRNKDVHEGRTAYQRSIEDIPVAGSYQDGSCRIEVFAPPGVSPAIIHKPKRVFFMNGEHEDVVSACGRYVEH